MLQPRKQLCGAKKMLEGHLESLQHMATKMLGCIELQKAVSHAVRVPALPDQNTVSRSIIAEPLRLGEGAVLLWHTWLSAAASCYLTACKPPAACQPSLGPVVPTDCKFRLRYSSYADL